MRKQTAILLSMGMIAGLVSGCTGNSVTQETASLPEETSVQEQGETGEETEKSAAEQVMDDLYAQIADQQIELELWTGPDWKGVYDSSVEGGDYLDFFNFVKAEFEEKYPNIKVNPVLIDGSQRAEKLAIAIQSGTLPSRFLIS